MYWTNRQDEEHGNPYVDKSSLWAFLKYPYARKVVNCSMTGLLTGRFHLKVHLFKLGIV
jgi:hypothetical protein